MLRRSAAVLAVVLYLAKISTSRAEPGPVVNWLMNEPASLFDIGMLRLNLALKRRWGSHAGDSSKEPKCLKEHGCTLITSADYSYRENRIHILLDQYVAREISQDEVKEICRGLIGHLRLLGGVRPSWGDYNNTDSSSYAEHFTHYGFARKTEPDNYLSRLDELIELRVIVKALPETEPELFLIAVCTGPLLSNKVYFEE